MPPRRRCRRSVLNVDGRTLAEAVSSSLSALHGFAGPQAPAFDGMAAFVGGDHNYPDN